MGFLSEATRSCMWCWHVIIFSADLWFNHQTHKSTWGCSFVLLVTVMLSGVVRNAGGSSNPNELIDHRSHRPGSQFSKPAMTSFLQCLELQGREDIMVVCWYGLHSRDVAKDSRCKISGRKIEKLIALHFCYLDTQNSWLSASFFFRCQKIMVTIFPRSEPLHFYSDQIPFLMFLLMPTGFSWKS